jgi:CRP/FNR family transcriptional regulator, dissimilatory nitrate respiration regulator
MHLSSPSAEPKWRRCESRIAHGHDLRCQGEHTQVVEYFAEATMKHPQLPAFPAALRPHASRRTYVAGATIFRAGSPTRWVYYLASGCVRLIRRGRAGEEIVLHQARSGEFFAEASIDAARYHCDAVAMETATVLRVSAADLTNLIAADSEFARQWISLLARQLRAVRTRVERLSLKSAAERIRHFLLSGASGAAGYVKVCKFSGLR